MSDEIQVRSKCTNGCVNGHSVITDTDGTFEILPCIVCGGKGYVYRWVTCPVELEEVK